MAVKRSQSAARVLAVFEYIARHQPIGVTELAEKLSADKSAIQRDLMTLFDGGWIQAVPGATKRWEIGPHILSVLRHVHSGADLRQRARPVMEALHKKTGETILLAVREGHQFITVEVIESSHFLRTAAHVGLVIPVVGSATGRAILAYSSEEEQVTLLGVPADKRLRAHIKSTLANGYAISEGDVYAGSTNIAAPIFDTSGYPEAALIVSAPADRLPAKYFSTVGELVKAAATKLSSSKPRLG